jgi:hypothetical protein
LFSGVFASGKTAIFPRDFDLCAITSTTWIKKTDYRELEFQPSLHAFATQRTDL